MSMDYSRAAEWIVAENSFDPEHLGKSESIMCQCNGYLCLRNATDEFNPGEQRDLIVAGTFNKFDDNEVTELPNAADVSRLDLRLDGIRFNLLTGSIEEYDRSLNLKTGETVRRVVWTAPNGKRCQLEFCRFVSMERLHLIAQKVRVTPLDGGVSLDIAGGINGQMNNSGSQHFSEGDKRLFEGRHMQYNQTTGQSGIHFVFNTTFSFAMNGVPQGAKGFIVMDRRTIKQEFQVEIPAGSTLTVEKLSTVYTSRDRDSETLALADLQGKALAGHERYDGPALSEERKAELATMKNDLYRESLHQLSPADLSAEVKQTLDTLRASGLKLAIGSSSKNTRFILGQLGLGEYFDAISDGNNITRSKPDPEVFLKAAEMLGFTPDVCLVVEDAVSGAEAGHAGGFEVACVGDASRAGAGNYNMTSFPELLKVTDE